jgi:polar amino acid transport system substrate-binding protein
MYSKHREVSALEGRMWPKGLIVGGLLALLCWGGLATADQLEQIQAKGVLVVGTKADYKPLGFLDANGNVVGMEPDLAADLARRLHVALKIVPVTSSNRITELQAGNVDLIIATLGITDERRKIAGIIDPPYYASGSGVLYRRDFHVDDVGDLAGKTLCVVDGNIFLLELRTNYPLVKTEVFKNLTAAEGGLFSQRCDGLFFDDLPLLYKKKSQPDRFKDFEFAQLIEIDPLLWGIAVKLGEQRTAWGSFVSKTILDWHQSGFLLQAEKKWLGDNTVLLQALKQRWTASAPAPR